MGFRKTGEFYPPQEKEARFCDICHAAIADGTKWYDVREDDGAYENDRTWDVCSPACLAKLAGMLRAW
jgi:hypothetical protein